MKKAIFGGTFDPVHRGHLHIAKQALLQLKLDEVIFMPSGNPPHKKHKVVTDGSHRLEMVRIALEAFGEERFTISSFELKQNGLSFTYKTMESFSEKERNTEWYFIAGTDSLFDIEKWKHPERIFQCCTLVIFQRPGFDREDALRKSKEIKAKYNAKIENFTAGPVDISSTEIRFGEKIQDVTPEVLEYIHSHNLYR